MVVVKLMGGLGNQLFQYAFGRCLATQWNTELVLDVDFLLDRTERENFVFRDFDLDLFQLKSYHIFDNATKTKFYKKSIFKKPNIEITEKGFNFSKLSSNLKNRNVYLEGYWQSFKYFDEISFELRKELQFRNPLSEEQFNLSKKIKQTKSICINFRRTDFVTIPTAIQTHGIPSLDYYYKAIELIKENVGSDIEIFVFSDDIEWCKEQFHVKEITHFVSHALYKGERFSAYLQLMTFCKHFIIPNSTFGWWAAWLAKNEDKIVITPQKWFLDPVLQAQTQDLRPETWITIDA
jgi:hypothetical protein